MKINSVFIGLIFFYTCLDIQSQEINADLLQISALDLSDSSNMVYDINNELCSKIILHTDIKGLKFYSNRSVEKVIFNDSTYFVWIPFETSLFKILVSGYPLFELKLQSSDYKYTLYEYKFTASWFQKIIVKDTIKAILSFTTKPEDASLYINDKYIGQTPISVEMEDSVKFNYSIKKKFYKPVHDSDILNSKVKIINKDLGDMIKPEYFIIPNINIYFFPFAHSTDYANNYESMDNFYYGFCIGRLKKRGWYISLKGMYFPRKRDMDYDPLNGTSRFSNLIEAKKYRANFGLVSKIGSNFFALTGIGYSQEMNIYQIYSDPIDYSYKGFNFNVGGIFRIGKRILISIEYLYNIPVVKANEGLKSADADIGIGIGYSFNGNK